MINDRTPKATAAYDNFINDVNAGKYNANINPVANAALPDGFGFDNVTAQQSGGYNSAQLSNLSSNFTPAQAAAALSPTGVNPSQLSNSIQNATYQNVNPNRASQNYDAMEAARIADPANIGIKNAAGTNASLDYLFGKNAPQANTVGNYTAATAQGFNPYTNVTAGNSALPDYANAVSGNYSGVSASTINPYTGISANQSNSPTNVNAVESNLTLDRQAQGALDPTNALSKILSGNPDNPYLSSMNQANIDQAMRGYNDAIQNFNQQTMPSINNDAFAAGQYGGSRQGIAQGLAMQQMDRNARDLGIAAMNSGNQLYGNAYDQAQQRMATAASELNSQGLQNQQFTASNANDMAKFNTQNSLQNNQFNASSANDIAKFNAQNSLAQQQFNAQQQFSADQMNAQNATDMTKFNAQNANDMSKFNAQNTLQNNQFNAGLANQTALANAQNNLQNNQFFAGQSNDMSKFNAQNALQNQQFNAQQLNDYQSQLNTLYAQNQQFNAQQAQQNNQFNTSNALDTSKFNASNDFTQMQLNAQMQQDASKTNAQNQLQNNQFNATQANQLGLANAQSNLQNSQFNVANSIQNNQFLTGQANDLSKFNAQNQQAYDFFNVGQANDLSKFNTQAQVQNNQFIDSQANNMSLANAQTDLASRQWDAQTANQTNQFNASNNLDLNKYLYGQGVQNNQFNANLGTTNNQQAMANSQLNLQNAQAGLTGLTNQMGIQDSAYNSLNSLYSAPYDRASEALNNYAALAYGGTPLLGSKTASITPYQEQKSSSVCS